MSKLYKNLQQSINNIVPKAGQRGFLYSNNEFDSCPALGLENNNSMVTEDMEIDYLASLLVDSYLAKMKHVPTNEY